MVDVGAEEESSQADSAAAVPELSQWANAGYVGRNRAGE
jgi:hypothetical protein